MKIRFNNIIKNKEALKKDRLNGEMSKKEYIKEKSSNNNTKKNKEIINRNVLKEEKQKNISDTYVTPIFKVYKNGRRHYKICTKCC